jgi:hypothetical protein
MGFTEAMQAYSDYQSLCPRCKARAKAAGKRILVECRSGKHGRVKGGTLEGPPT